MKRDSRAPLVVAIVLLLLPVLYVGSYLALVAEPIRGEANYRIGDGYAVVMFFRPLENLDQWVRPQHWESEPVH